MLDEGLWVGDVEQSISVILEHADDPAVETYTKDASGLFGPYRLGHFSGLLRFGGVDVSLGSLAGNPQWLGKGRWQLEVGSGQASNGRTVAHTLAVPPLVLAQRDDHGVLTVMTGAVEVLGAKGFAWSGWNGTRGTTRLTTNGFSADSLQLTLPAGIGWRPENEVRLRSVYTLSGASIPLDSTLDPVGPATGTVAPAQEFFAETYPVEFRSSRWRWSQGTLSLVSPGTQFVRAAQYQSTLAATGALPTSNDAFWLLLRAAAASDLSISPGHAGGISVDLAFSSGAFSPHFPLAHVQAPKGGVLRILDGRADTTNSAFALASIRVDVGEGCRDPNAADAVPSPVTHVGLDDVDLHFTPTTGLWADGPSVLDAPGVQNHLDIGHNGGQPTHRTDPFPTLRVYVPGAWVSHEDGIDSAADANATVDDFGEDPTTFNPARHLLSGYRATPSSGLEHPETAAYAAGLADYAGANFRSTNGISAHSHVGGVDTPTYPLTARSKYYARLSGVSGIHESASGPAELPAYGYDIDLTNFGLSFLSNEPHDSRIEGSITLPLPSGFTQSFERLMLTCCGNLAEGTIDPADNQKQLSYWSGTRITTRSLRFTHDPNDPCATEDALLELGITADVGHLDEQPNGFLYPRPNGSLVAMDDLGRESHLSLSALVDLAGYPFMAVRRGYFNEHSAHPDGPGWINLAGKGGVSFFRDLRLHAHVLGSTANPQPPLFLKAGWTAASDNYFNQAGFDVAHRGFPDNTTATDYQTGSTHLPRALQIWAGLSFDYSVAYDNLTRSFRSPEPQGIDIGLFDTHTEVKHLTADLADLRFGASLEISLLAIPELVLEEGLSALSDVIEEEALEILARGLDRLASLLDAQMKQVIDDVVMPAVENTVVVPLVQQLPADGNAVGIEASLNLHLEGPLTEALSSLADATETADNLAEKAANALGDATAALETARNVLVTLQNIEGLILAGLERLGIDLDQLPEDLRGEVLTEIETGLAELEAPLGPDGVQALGRLAEIRNAIEDLESAIGDIIGALEQGQDFFEQLRETVIQPVGEYAQMGDDIKERLQSWLEGGFALNPGAYGAEELRVRVRQEIRDAYAALPVAGRLRNVFRSWVYNTDSAVRGALDTAFQAINEQIVDAAMIALDELETALQPVKTFSSVVESINLNGRAHIRGDRLSVLRLDSTVVVNMPTPIPAVQVPIEFAGFFEYRELTSDGSIGCLEAIPARTSEILVGSSVGPASIFGAGNRLTVQAKFTRDGDKNLLGLVGGLTMEHRGPDIQIVGLEELSATLSIRPGLKEGYISAFARGHWSFPYPVEMAGGVFLGRSCTWEPLSWDPQASEYLPVTVDPENAYTGVYFFGEAVMPFSTVGCLFDASLGAGARLFFTDPDFDFVDVTMGGRLDGNVSAELLCLARLRGHAFLEAGLDQGNFFFGGGVDVDGKIGVCPLCVSFGAGIEASYVKGSGWDISY